jgi:hypothetical protein
VANSAIAAALVMIRTFIVGLLVLVGATHMNLAECAYPGSSSDDAASSLEYECISPHAIELCDALPCAENSKATRGVKCNACFVLGKHRCLEHPSSVLFRGTDQRLEELPANPPPSR